jgi:4-hydroxybenzoate polyprenyltransferase
VQTGGTIRGAPNGRGRLVEMMQGMARVAVSVFMRVFVYSSAWVAGALASIAAFACHVLGVTAWEPAALVFASGMFIYNLDHVADARVQEIPDAEAQRYFRHPLVLLLLVGSAVATGLLVGQAPRPAQWIFGGYASVGLLYGLPVLPVPTRAGLRWRRLKEIPWFKGWLVAGTITTGTVLLPAAWGGAPIGLDLLPLAIFVFVFGATNTHMFDVRDLASDERSGVHTLPVAVGVRRTKLALVLLNLVMLAALTWGWGAATVGQHPAVAISLAVSILYVLLLDEDTPRQVYGVAIDGCWYLPFLLSALPHGP